MPANEAPARSRHSLQRHPPRLKAHTDPRHSLQRSPQPPAYIAAQLPECCTHGRGRPRARDSPLRLQEAVRKHPTDATPQQTDQKKKKKSNCQPIKTTKAQAHPPPTPQVFSDFAAHRFGSLLHSSTHEVVLRKLSWVPQQHKCKVRPPRPPRPSTTELPTPRRTCALARPGAGKTPTQSSAAHGDVSTRMGEGRRLKSLFRPAIPHTHNCLCPLPPCASISCKVPPQLAIRAAPPATLPPTSSPLPQVYRFTTRLAHHIGTAEHVSRRRALQASKLALLRAAHPHIRLWVDLVNEYAPYAAGPVAGPVRGSGSSQTSQTARQLLESDRRTQKSSRMLEREGAPARRTPMPGDKEGGDAVAAGGSSRAGTSGATEEVGGEPTDEGGAAAGPRRRMLPGAGAGFVTKWQQQYRIEALRRCAPRWGNNAPILVAVRLAVWALLRRLH